MQNLKMALAVAGVCSCNHENSKFNNIILTKCFRRGRIASARDERKSEFWGRMQYAPDCGILIMIVI